MSTDQTVGEAIELLQQLGLKEYEARCFVGLMRLNTGTAKELSEVTEVPRTRIYDAIRVLEAQGLVEVQHSSPQQFRAIPLDEATDTLRDQYDQRVERLHSSLEAIETIETGDDSTVQEVWTLTGETAIGNRTSNLVESAQHEVVLVIGKASLLTDDLIETLSDLPDEVDLVVGTTSEHLENRIEREVPRATTFISGLEWLQGSTDEHATSIGRLLLVDRSTILVSTITNDSGEERAIFGSGFGNGLVVIARRLMAQGLVPMRDPGGM